MDWLMSGITANFQLNSTAEVVHRRPINAFNCSLQPQHHTNYSINSYNHIIATMQVSLCWSVLSLNNCRILLGQFFCLC